MKNEATERAKMPEGTAAVLDIRTLSNSYATIIPILRKGMRVLDIGCGTGAISAGIAEAVGPEGKVVGIDSSDHLIAKGKADHAGLQNLELIEADLFSYKPDQLFDLVVSARVFQWLSNPIEALAKCREFLRPAGNKSGEGLVGIVSILDYNHTRLQWNPQPPASMSRFYNAFLKWRADAGMDNEMADHLPAHFKRLGFHSVESLKADEVYKKGNPDFTAKVGIWSKVAESRGLQMVSSGYISEKERILAIEEYNAWIEEVAESMTMNLTEVRGMAPE